MAANSEYYQGTSKTFEEAQEEIKNLKASVQIINRVFGISEEEYGQFINTSFENKLNEVLYVIFKEQYVKGISAQETEQEETQDSEAEVTQPSQGEEYKEHLEEHSQETIVSIDGTEYLKFLEKFADVKQYIIAQYTDIEQRLLKECSATGTVPDSVITNIVKSNVIPGEPDENGNVKNQFTLTVNSNYVVKWSLEYTIGPEGKIVSDITATPKPIKNY